MVKLTNINTTENSFPLKNGKTDQYIVWGDFHEYFMRGGDNLLEVQSLLLKSFQSSCQI